ncbi:hypothetical protein BLNAU_21361 [Blattamonas nauphoetae]|uniref:Uncharacterized protein n=1 Tax=Blattamonas nauphoetae TaxID=2049346 RepID=A0ABQ9WW46_9EUKA|nr:hypothetical protein BLNAU_21361 [Blattamonas nauphoetae]
MQGNSYKSLRSRDRLSQRLPAGSADLQQLHSGLRIQGRTTSVVCPKLCVPITRLPSMHDRRCRIWGCQRRGEIRRSSLVFFESHAPFRTRNGRTGSDYQFHAMESDRLGRG